MRGRQLYKCTKPLLNFFAVALKIIPRFIRVFIWDMISPYSQIVFIGARYVLLKSMIKHCGDNVMVGKNVVIRGWENLAIGDNSSINANCYIDASYGGA